MSAMITELDERDLDLAMPLVYPLPKIQNLLMAIPMS